MFTNEQNYAFYLSIICAGLLGVMFALVTIIGKFANRSGDITIFNTELFGSYMMMGSGLIGVLSVIFHREEIMETYSYLCLILNMMVGLMTGFAFFC